MSHTGSSETRRSKYMVYLLALLVAIILFLIMYSSCGTSSDANSCGCEGIQYAKRVKDDKESLQAKMPTQPYRQPSRQPYPQPPRREGIKSTYTVESPALKAMFGAKESLQSGHNMSQQFNIMKSRPADKSIPTKSKEGLDYKPRKPGQERFVNGYTHPPVFRSSGTASQSPFFGPISL